MDKRTLFVTFEGIEGSGKSSQISNVSDYFIEQGRSVVRTREPGGTAIAEKIRDLIIHQQEEKLSQRAELLLMLAARAQHVDELIRKNVGVVDLILCDRFTDSTLAYQGGGRGMNMNVLRDLNDQATGGLQPDVTFLMDLQVADSQTRIINRKKRNQRSKKIDRFESETIAFHEKIRNAYLALAKEEPNRIMVLNAIEKPKQIFQQIITEIERRLNP
ncbi:MAG: dTMP kinase [Proteobacteria bacterium]|nr:dTMP kinase [Pseudomonadota bacterium]